MKLERISENQIRCTLTRNDLAERELKLSELAYGTDKAKALFHDMMDQAAEELGFEAGNIPIVIEAVPISSECIMLIITKCEDPEELDTRFSKFSQYAESDVEDDSDVFSGANEILDIFKKLTSDLVAKAEPLPFDGAKTHSDAGDSDIDDEEDMTDTSQGTRTHIRIFEFNQLSDVSELSYALTEDQACASVLYKNPKTKKYYLVLNSDGISTEFFMEICKVASEFGRLQKASINTLYYFDEHYETIIKQNALAVLRSI